MTTAPVHLPQHLPTPRGLGETQRRDAWWSMPSAIAIGLVAFLVYGTWCAWQGQHYYFHGPAGQNYLSPFFSPLFYETQAAVASGKPSLHAWMSGAKPDWWPAFLPFAPAVLILWAPAGFRFTCYGFRGHYYKGLWADPMSCAVGEPAFRGNKYRGEAKWPLLIQNSHRYFLYVIIVLLLVKFYDMYEMLWFFDDPAKADLAHRHFGLGVGSLVLLAEPILLALYVGGCHSLRHLVAGRKDVIGTGINRKRYDCVSCLNRKHMLWGWASLLWIMFADVYVRLCSMGVIPDLKLIG